MKVTFRFMHPKSNSEADIILSRNHLKGQGDEENGPVRRGMERVLEKLASRGVAPVEKDRRTLQNTVTKLYYGFPPLDPVTLQVYEAPEIGEEEEQASAADLTSRLMAHKCVWVDYHRSDPIQARNQVEQVAKMQQMKVLYWNLSEGLVPEVDGGPGGDSQEPEVALRQLLEMRVTEDTLFLLDGLPDDDYTVTNTPVGSLVTRLCERVQDDRSLYLTVLAPENEVPPQWTGLFRVVVLGTERRELEILNDIGRDLTLEARNGNLPQLVGRGQELQRMMEILNCAPGAPNSVLLVGPAGTGKTAIVEGLARLIARGDVPERFRGRRLFEISVTSLIADSSLRGQLEERVHHLIEEVGANKEQLILFLDEAHALMGGGEGREVAQSLKQALSRGDFPLIAATTDEEVSPIREDKAFARRFTEVRVDEPTLDEAISILQARRSKLERSNQVSIPSEVVKAAVEDSDEHILDEHLPSKAIKLLYEVASRAQLRGRRRVTVEDIRSAISERTGSPIASPDQDERDRLKGLRERLAESVLFQPLAIKRLSSAVIARRMSQRRNSRPLAFLFVGPSGVGKTSLAQSLAQVHFGGAQDLHRYDMSEFAEPHQVARLLGAPPGYVGYSEGSRLIRDIRRQPYSVVLFDEIEKAHPRVILSLMGIIDEGTAEFALQVGDFRHAVIILTSNLLRKPGLEELSPQELRQEVTEAFRFEGVPTEFVGRVEIVPFHDLTAGEMVEVAAKMLDELVKEMREEFELEIRTATDAARGLVASSRVEGQGVRPVRVRLEELRRDLISRVTLDLARVPRAVTLAYDEKVEAFEWRVKQQERWQKR